MTADNVFMQNLLLCDRILAEEIDTEKLKTHGFAPWREGIDENGPFTVFSKEIDLKARFTANLGVFVRNGQGEIYGFNTGQMSGNGIRDDMYWNEYLSCVRFMTRNGEPEKAMNDILRSVMELEDSCKMKLEWR